MGRLVGVRDTQAQFSGSLRNHCAMADLKLGRLLDTIDSWVDEHRARQRSAGGAAIRRRRGSKNARASRSTSRRSSIGTVIWATGFRPDYWWLHVPVLDRKGRLRHDGGIVDAPGPVRARASTSCVGASPRFIHGAEDDVRDLSAHSSGYLRGAEQRVVIDGRNGLEPGLRLLGALIRYAARRT